MLQKLFKIFAAAVCWDRIRLAKLRRRKADQDDTPINEGYYGADSEATKYANWTVCLTTFWRPADCILVGGYFRLATIGGGPPRFYAKDFYPLLITGGTLDSSHSAYSWARGKGEQSRNHESLMILRRKISKFWLILEKRMDPRRRWRRCYPKLRNFLISRKATVLCGIERLPQLGSSIRDAGFVEIFQPRMG